MVHICICLHIIKIMFTIYLNKVLKVKFLDLMFIFAVFKGINVLVSLMYTNSI